MDYRHDSSSGRVFWTYTLALVSARCPFSSWVPDFRCAFGRKNDLCIHFCPAAICIHVPYVLLLPHFYVERLNVDRDR